MEIVAFALAFRVDPREPSTYGGRNDGGRKPYDTCQFDNACDVSTGVRSDARSDTRRIVVSTVSFETRAGSSLSILRTRFARVLRLPATLSNLSARQCGHFRLLRRRFFAPFQISPVHPCDVKPKVVRLPFVKVIVSCVFETIRTFYRSVFARIAFKVQIEPSVQVQCKP